MVEQDEEEQLNKNLNQKQCPGGEVTLTDFSFEHLWPGLLFVSRLSNFYRSSVFLLLFFLLQIEQSSLCS